MKELKGQQDPVKTYEYNQLLSEKTGCEKHVLINKKNCEYDNCYKRYINLENGGEILLRID